MVGWILLRTLPSSASKGVKYFEAIVVNSWPMTHPMNIAWMDENMGSVGKKAVASGLLIASANIYGSEFITKHYYTTLWLMTDTTVWASQIYQDDDSPGTSFDLQIIFTF